MSYIIRILGLIFLTASGLSAQLVDTLSLSKCYTLARNNYPLIKQLELIKQIRDYNLDNLSKGYLPSIIINGQATYQSEVTELPMSIPNIDVPSLSKDQYKLYADIYQNIYDGGINSIQRKITAANSEVEQEKTEVELFKLKDRINQLFFGVLLIDAQLKQTEFILSDIHNALNKSNAAVKNGTALPSSSSMLEAELLNIDQKKTELSANRMAFINILTLMIGEQISELTTFIVPSVPIKSDINQRPELKWFESQKNIFSLQNELIKSKNSIKVGLFAQLGYGRPAFNFLSNSFSPYYIGGVKVNWNLSNMYTSHNERSLLLVNSRSVDIQKETFLLNNELTVKQQDSEINKYKELIITDSKIIELRSKILHVSQSQLANGTISTLDYLTNINALDQAKQNLILHELQLLQSQINYQNSLGN
ncbi:MAG: TolC family protein [Saprospiraceae bacterium]